MELLTSILDFLLTYKAFLLIPIISATVGWGTNWMALKMTFYPLEFVGIRPFGWQGIIPSKAKKMAEKSVELFTTKLIKVDEQFMLIDPKKVAEEMSPILNELSREITNEVVNAQIPRIWDNTPDLIKEGIYKNICEELPLVVEKIIEQVRTDINELLNIKTLSVTELLKNKQLLNDIFQKVGKEEFRFIEHSGWMFGFPLGIIQMLIVYFYDQNALNWLTEAQAIIGTGILLAFFGLLVGWLTNYLALKLIFEPLKPKKILFFWSYQGLFIKRQEDVSTEYAKLITQNILTTENMFEFMVRGEGATHFKEIIEKHISIVVDKTVEEAKPWSQLFTNQKQLDTVKNITAFRFEEELPISIRNIYGYAEEALNLNHTMAHRMATLPPDEFVGFLRPAFQEDEWILISVGAILGCLAGITQFFAFF